MLTTIDLPVVSHVTRASVTEPFLGMMLTLDVPLLAPNTSDCTSAQRPVDIPRPLPM